MAAGKSVCSYLPDELWEFIFKFLLSRGDDHNTLKSLSVVSKEFLSITNRLQFSLTVINQTIPFLPRLFQRFPNITSLNLILSCDSSWKANLVRISTFPLEIKSLYLSNRSGNFRFDGMQPLSKKMKMLSYSIICSKMCYIDKNDLVLVTACDPSRKELEFSFPMISVNFSFLIIDYDVDDDGVDDDDDAS